LDDFDTKVPSNQRPAIVQSIALFAAAAAALTCSGAGAIDPQPNSVMVNEFLSSHNATAISEDYKNESA